MKKQELKEKTMALRRIQIDIEDAGRDKRGRLLYNLAIVSSEDGEKQTENLTAGKLHTLVEFAVSSALDSLPVWSSD